ncbi:MAG: hypothetical protein Ct9H300mP1_21110 [Planctomycetaceae bacterium]|nr:MAG: hypothetical protein Ct9H300mP1_21110 [Planctomycetaceae bacterium]
MRRLRTHPRLREMVRETRLSPSDFILPLFIRHGENQRLPISSMPGHSQLTVDLLAEEVKEIASLGIPAVILFGIPAEKDAVGSDACDDQGIVAEAVRAIKASGTDLLVITDVCFCELPTTATAGSSTTAMEPGCRNDATLEILATQAVTQPGRCRMVAHRE